MNHIDGVGVFSGGGIGGGTLLLEIIEKVTGKQAL
jgi:hypothetical protein